MEHVKFYGKLIDFAEIYDKNHKQWDEYTQNYCEAVVDMLDTSSLPITLNEDAVEAFVENMTGDNVVNIDTCNKFDGSSYNFENMEADEIWVDINRTLQGPTCYIRFTSDNQGNSFDDGTFVFHFGSDDVRIELPKEVGNRIKEVIDPYEFVDQEKLQHDIDEWSREEEDRLLAQIGPFLRKSVVAGASCDFGDHWDSFIEANCRGYDPEDYISTEGLYNAFEEAFDVICYEKKLDCKEGKRPLEHYTEVKEPWVNRAGKEDTIVFDSDIKEYKEITGKTIKLPKESLASKPASVRR